VGPFEWEIRCMLRSDVKTITEGSWSYRNMVVEGGIVLL
jgi:hypothetical protein